jgi:endonuclease YncB( thermonuclease family)
MLHRQSAHQRAAPTRPALRRTPCRPAAFRPFASAAGAASGSSSGGSWQASGTALLSALVLLTSQPGAAHAAENVLAGVARVVDGDTLYVQGEKIRLFGVDAPEKAQLCTDAKGGNYECGQVSLKELNSKLEGHPVVCSVRNKDMYGRNVASCEVQLAGGREDVGAWLVSNGYAVAYRCAAGSAPQQQGLRGG